MRMEILLNIIHYCIYKADNKRHLLSNKINPLAQLGKIPAVKRKLEERGINLDEATNKIWADKGYGFSILISGAALVVFLFVLLVSIFDILNSLFRFPFTNLLYAHVICMGLGYAICHFLVFKKDKYLKYFKQFDKWDKREKWKYGIFSFIFIVFVICIFIYSFSFL